MQLGRQQLKTGAALAPMAGVSDAAMRAICARYGAIFTVSEMVSAKALAMGDKKSRRLLADGGGEAPYGVQLFGPNETDMAEAVRRIEEETFDFLDLNFGCPAPKVAQHGSGSALLKDPPLAGRIAKAAVAASSRPVTAKMRIGWDAETLTGVEVAQWLADAGVCMLAVHARTREEMYHPGVHYDAVAAIKQAVKIPVLFNGDVADGPSAIEALRQTGCDGVMIGRAAMGRPWVFREVAAALAGREIPAEPTLRERFAVMDEQLQALCARMGEEAGMRQARGVMSWYVRGLRGAAALRREAVRISRYSEVAALIALAFELQKRTDLPPDDSTDFIQTAGG